MKIALCGAARSGKTTLFEILTGPDHHATRGGGPGEIHLGTARVADDRLDRLAAMYNPKKITPATLHFVDLAAVQEGSRSDAALVAELRAADGLLLMVRAWEDEADPHPAGSIDPARDVDLILTEFLLADHDIAERRVEKLESLVAKAHRSEDQVELDQLRPVVDALAAGTPVRALDLAEDQARGLRGYGFLTAKPLLVAMNLGEDDTTRIGEGPEAFGLGELLSGPGIEFVALSARIEGEIAALGEEDAEAFRKDLGLTDPVLERLLQACYRMMGLITFFTVIGNECRAWTVPHGSHAHEAAGAIHSDMERGFIRAEVIPCETLFEAGSWAAARQAGRIKVEGKNHIVHDGDVLEIRFAI